MLMPFGKYKGEPIEDIPDNYLQWLITEVSLREPLRSAVCLEIAARRDRYCKDNAVVTIDCARVKAIYRNMAMKWHPDVGGTIEAMQAVNEFYEELMN
jgi:hypothetical protein